jgi:hypothetical protein
LDPFTVEFAKAACDRPVDQNFMSHFNQMANTKIAPTRLPLTGSDWLTLVHVRLLSELQFAVTPKVQEKYFWLLNRITPRVIHPMSGRIDSA